MEIQKAPNTANELLVFPLSITSPSEKPRKEELEKFRINTALEVLKLLESGNVGVVAQTGSGKTIIAFLSTIWALSKMGYRTLFLVPQRILAHQHHKLLNEVASRAEISSQVIIGGVKKRGWGDKNISFVFATPQTFYKDMVRGKTKIEDFQILVLDEFHHATGKYSYVPIAKEAHEKGVKIIGLSASPGESKEKVKRVGKLCFITHWIKAEVEMPKKLEDVVTAECDETLNLIDQKFSSLIKILTIQLQATRFLQKKVKAENFKLFPELTKSNVKLLSEKELDGLSSKLKTELKEERKLRHREDEPSARETRTKEAIQLYVIYRKLKRAYSACITEGYETFLKYVEKLETEVEKEKNIHWKRGEKGTPTERLLRNKTFAEIISIAKENKDKHPKILMLLRTVSSLSRSHSNALIFIRERNTAHCIKNALITNGVNTETLFGGRDKNIHKQEEVLEKLKNRELDFVISTSVVEEGLNVPEIGAIIHYSMPTMGIVRIQRGGRTARTAIGNIIFIRLDHAFDKAMYWSSWKKIQEMNKALDELQNPNPAPVEEKEKKSKKDSKRCKFTIDMFEKIPA